MQHFIFANMLRHWDKTAIVIQKESKGKFVGKNYLDHPYIAKVKRVYHNCDISEGILQSWVTIVREGFIKKNSISISAPMCQEVVYDNATVDTRSFLEKIDASSKE